ALSAHGDRARDRTLARGSAPLYGEDGTQPPPPLAPSSVGPLRLHLRRGVRRPPPPRRRPPRDGERVHPLVRRGALDRLRWVDRPVGASRSPCAGASPPPVRDATSSAGCLRMTASAFPSAALGPRVETRRLGRWTVHAIQAGG